MKDTLTDSSLILYQTEDGQTRIEVQLLDETVWLSQALLAPKQLNLRKLSNAGGLESSGCPTQSKTKA